MCDTITEENLGLYVCSRGTYVGMTPFRECPELQLGSCDKNKTHPGGKAADKIRIGSANKNPAGKEAFVARNHRAFAQLGCACSHTNRELLHKYYAEIARERMHRDEHHLIEK